MITQTKLVTGALAAGLARAACGSVAETSGQGNHAKPFAQHHVQRGGSTVDDVTDLASLKRDLQRTAMEDARARTSLRSVLGTRSAPSPDSGLAGCSSVLGADQVAARDYPKIAAQFAGSRWPDLRSSGLAYVEIATRLRATHAYGGETVWFIERLAAACAKHGRAGNRFAI